MPLLPENTIKITELSAGTVKGGSLLATSEPDSSTPPVYSSSKVSAADIADFVANDKNYAELTETTDKTIIGAINEIAQGGGGGGSSTLAGLTDVDITTPTDGQVLSYDSVNQEWVNADVGDASKVELTQAEYDALEQAGEIDPTVMYFITDGQSGNEIIDDTTTSASKVWSSDKTDDEIQAVASDVATKQDLLEGGGLTSGTDLDTLKSNKVYWCPNSGLTHAPVNAYGFLEVDASTGTSVLQKYYVFAGNQYANRGDTYRRIFINSQWYDWVKIASATPENIKVTRTNLTQQGGALNSFVFAAPAITGYTRMIVGFNPSLSNAMYARFEEDGDNLKVLIQNNLGTSITYDVTIAVAYIKN